VQLPVVTELDPRVWAGLMAQRERRAASLAAGAARVGWKMGRGIEEIEAVMGSEPVIGYLTSETLFESGSRHRADGAVALRAEIELALWVRDPERQGDESEAIGGVATALELVDVQQGGRGAIEPILAANVFHRAFAIGEVQPLTATAGRQARLWIDGELRGSGRLLDDYTDTVRAAQRCLMAIGETLRPGDFILAGAAVHVPVSAGERVSGEIDGLSRLRVTIAA
jgi:2-keto-4-pentenoate hydratase